MDTAQDAAAWALKERCLAAWSTDPGATADAAAALRALCGGAAATPQAVVHALADWCEGIALLARGEAGAAQQSLERAQAGFAARGEPGHAAQTQVAQVMALSLQGRFDDAARCAGEAKATFVAVGDLDAAAKISLNLGSLSLHRDAYDDAVGHYREAAVRFARAGQHEHSVMADVGLADALAYRGDQAEAARIYARAAMRAAHHSLPVLQASARHGRALLDLAQGRYADALAGLELSRREFAALDAEHLQLEAELTLADAYLELRLLPEAIRLYRELAGRLQQRDAAATLAWSQARLAQALALRGERGAAVALLAQAAQRFEDQANPTGRAAVWLVQSQLLQSAGEAGQALALAQRAEASLEASAELAPLARLRVAESRLALGDAAAAEAGCTALLAGQPSAYLRARVLATRAAALGLRRDAAERQALEQAIDAAEEVRAALPGDDLRRAVLADAGAVHVQRLKLALDDASADPARVPEVLHWLESFKARALADRLGRTPAPPQAAPADRAELEALRSRLELLYRRQRQQLQSGDGESSAALRAQAAQLEQALLERARRDRLAAGGGIAAAAVPAALADQLLRRLEPGTAMVEYGIAGDEVFALVAFEGSWRLWRGLSTAAELSDRVRALRFQLDAMRPSAALNPAHAPQLLARVQRRLQQLHDCVWAPLADALAGARRLLIVPHGPLHAVPFAALGGGPRASLIDRHEICYAASAAVALAGLGRDPQPPAEALLVGDSRRVPGSEVEIEALAGLFPQAQRLQGAQAQVESLCRLAPAAGLLHLACHGEFRGDSPLHSSLQLADGVLAAVQVEALPLRAALVVLGACDSALGEAGAGDEGVGLVRAFLIAGAARVLGCQWQVQDADAAELMPRFHRAWRGGHSAAAALRQAQLELRERTAHPYHWAAYALHGGG